jgi:hypothetical protein
VIDATPYLIPPLAILVKIVGIVDFIPDIRFLNLGIGSALEVEVKILGEIPTQ